MTPDLRALEGRPVIVGAGLAGLMTALALAPKPVVLLSKAPLGQESSSMLAQGGIAASLGGDDSPALHHADTMKAGGGLNDPEVVRHVVTAAPAAIESLMRHGVRFDCDSDGVPLLGLEAAHSRRRILHAGGDGSGREIVRALVEAVRRTPSIAVLEGVEARRLTTEDSRVTGLILARGTETAFLATAQVVIATGGIGGLFLDATTPQGSFGHGLALAARSGAALADLEFIQFHPTALDAPDRPMHLISEAVRGDGAVLIDETGRRFLQDVDGAELAPRDIVARALWNHLARGHSVFLDARMRPGAAFATRFPGIDTLCKAAGFDPALEPIPVRPAVHYHMGGIAVDLHGRATLEGLWACGEAACTGLHGANRLASNSLLEAAVLARIVAESVAGAPAARGSLQHRVETARPDPTPLRPIVSRALGLVRTEGDLRQAIAELLPRATSESPEADPAAVALMLAVAALQRRESRGAHFRADFPHKAEKAQSSRLTFGEALTAASEAVGAPAPPFARSA